MKVPVPLKLAAIAVASTGFYAWVGQLVPQKEVHPPEVVEIAADVSTAQMADIGREIFDGKGLCSTCHTIGRSGALRFPDLAGVATRAGGRVPGLSALGYFAQSLYQPDAFIVPGFIPGMPAADRPPVGLTDDEIKTVIAYLQSLGGEPTITMATVLVQEGELVSDPSPGAAAPPDTPALATVDAAAAAAVLDDAGAIPEADDGAPSGLTPGPPPGEGGAA